MDIFERNRIKRVPVMDNGKLVGIVSRANLLQALGSFSGQITTPSISDRRIRDQVLAELGMLPWGLVSESNVVVKGGVVHLWGLVTTPEEQTTLRVAAEAIRGVRGVEDHTVLIHND